MGRRSKRKVSSIVYYCNDSKIIYNCSSIDEFRKSRYENMKKIMENKEFSNSKRKCQVIDAGNQNLIVRNINIIDDAEQSLEDENNIVINNPFFDIDVEEECDNLYKFDENDNEWNFYHEDEFFL